MKVWYTKIMNKKVLIIEDEQVVREIFKDELERQGFFIIEAKDGEEGMEKAIDEHPDVVLLDLIMPRMAGKEFFRQLRQRDWVKKVPIIVLTNVNSKEEERILGEYSIAAYLVKSQLDLERVIEKIKDQV